jgi:hypothetical protein
MKTKKYNLDECREAGEEGMKEMREKGLWRR